MSELKMRTVDISFYIEARRVAINQPTTKEPTMANDDIMYLYDSQTNERIRIATQAETDESFACAQPEGNIEVDGRLCYVDH